jgi:hypothetical protein
MKLYSLTVTWDKNDRVIFRCKKNGRDVEIRLDEKAFIEMAGPEADKQITKHELAEGVKTLRAETEKIVMAVQNQDLREQKLQDMKSAEFHTDLERRIRNRLLAIKKVSVGKKNFEGFINKIIADANKLFESVKKKIGG